MLYTALGWSYFELEPSGSAVTVGLIYQSDDKQSYEIGLRVTKNNNNTQEPNCNVPVLFSPSLHFQIPPFL